MTYIVPICYVADQLVVATDKRLVIGLEIDDTFNKLIKLGNAALGSACGVPRCSHPETNAVQFDAYQLMNDFFAEKHVDQKSVTAFGDHIVAKHAEYIQQHKDGQPFDKKYKLFTVAIYAPFNGRIVQHVLVVEYDPAKGAYFTPYSNLLKNSRVIIHGDPDVVKKMEDGDPVFKELWDKQGMAALLQSDLPFGSLTRDQAVKAAREIIAQASAKSATIRSDKKSTISATCDIAILGPQGIIDP